MTRTTIDFGIDLGTTNSAVAVARGAGAEVIKNHDERETTPSAIWIDRRNRLYVGKTAKNRSGLDVGNSCVEFKRRMGVAGEPVVFQASGRLMAPEEMSAEVLKSLRADVTRRLGETLEAAVITVPAAFGLSGCDATRRAAGLAGLRHAPLLREPVAAALAYGVQTTADNVFWLVYDLGGGTFDSAVMRVRDGELTVVNHRGDNYLGGNLMDWKIVEELLIPAFNEQYPRAGFRRGDPRWAMGAAVLKQHAEEARIRLSRAGVAEITVVLRDGDGRAFEFMHDVTRADAERLAEPLIARSVGLCRTALDESGLGPGDIEKVLLVGGPTLAPYLRDRLADPGEGLGIALDHSQDPITVVARGAAIFGGSQRIPDAVQGPAPRIAGRYAADLEYQPSLTHSIGVGLADHTFDPLVRRGAPLPARQEVSLRTTVGVHRGEDRGIVLVPILEGEHRRADRNRRVGRVEIVPGQVRRDVPEGSEVRLTIVIDETRLVIARAYLPVLDEEFEYVLNLRDKTVPDHEDLARQFQAEKSRIAAAREQAAGVGDAAAREKLASIDSERVVPEIAALVEAARADPDAALTCADLLLSLRAAVDEVEDALDWPLLIQEARELSDAAREVVTDRGDAEHRRLLAAADAAVRDAITAHDPDLLTQRMDDLRVLGSRVLDDSGDLPLLVFEDLRSRQTEMSDPREAGLLISAGRRAAEVGDMATLRHLNVQLAGLLPAAQPPRSPFSTVRRDL